MLSSLVLPCISTSQVISEWSNGCLEQNWSYSCWKLTLIHVQIRHFTDATHFNFFFNKFWRVVLLLYLFTSCSPQNIILLELHILKFVERLCWKKASSFFKISAAFHKWMCRKHCLPLCWGECLPTFPETISNETIATGLIFCFCSKRFITMYRSAPSSIRGHNTSVSTPQSKHYCLVKKKIHHNSSTAIKARQNALTFFTIAHSH